MYKAICMYLVIPARGPQSVSFGILALALFILAVDLFVLALALFILTLALFILALYLFILSLDLFILTFCFPSGLSRPEDTWVSWGNFPVGA